MAWTWTENQSLTFTDATPAKDASGKVNCDLAASNFVKAEIQISITWGSNGDGPALIQVFGSSDSGTTIDTEPLFELEVDETASGTKIISIPLNGPYRQIEITNQNAYSEDITLASEWAGLAWS
jgi:hypothetical protein